MKFLVKNSLCRYNVPNINYVYYTRYKTMKAPNIIIVYIYVHKYIFVYFYATMEIFQYKKTVI